MLKRTLPWWLLLAGLAAVPVLARDFHSWRDDASGITGSSIGQQTSHQAFNLYDSFTVAGDSTYSLFWENEHTTNGGQTNTPFGDEPPSVQPDAQNGVKDNRQQADEQSWITWPVVTSKTAAPPRPTFTPQVPQAWSPVVVDLGDVSIAGELPDHVLLSVNFEPEPPAGSTGRLREQILNVYYPGTADGLPGNATARAAEERGTVRPFWVRGGNRLTPGLRLRDLEPLRGTLSAGNPGVGVVTQPPIFARVPAIYKKDSSFISEVLPVVFLVVGTGENGDPARVICLSLKKPATQRGMDDPANDWLPTRGQLPNIGYTEPPTPDFFVPNGGGGGAVMWSYTVTGRNGSGISPVAGISFANVGSTNDSRPLIFVTTADGQVICLNAKAADLRAIGEDGDPAIVPNNPTPRWRWTTPTLFPGLPEEETPGFSYGQAAAVARVPISGAFSSNANDPSFNTATRALAKGASDWMLFVVDTFGTFRGFEAPGKPFPLTGTLTRHDPSVRWSDVPPNNTFRLDPQGNRERFIVPPLVYQGGTPLNTENGALVSGSSDVGFDDEVVFASERGNLYSLDCLGEFTVSGNANTDGTPVGTTQTRWRFPQDDTVFDPAAGVEPRVWPREMEDPFSAAFENNGHTTDPYGNTLSASEQRFGKAINTSDPAYDGYYTRGPLAVTLGANANPNGSVPNLDPGDDTLFVPYLEEQPDTTIKIGPTSAGANPTVAARTVTKPSGHRWFYEYVGSVKPYGFVQASRPIKELRTARATVNGVTFNIPLNRVRVGTVKFNGLPTNRVRNILAPGPVGANPNYDPAGPTPQDTVYISDTQWYDDTNSIWRTLPLGATVTISYVPPRSATDSSNGAVVTEVLVYPSCYRAIPSAADPFNTTVFDVVRGRASLTVDRTRLEQRLLQRARAASGATPARPDTLYEEDPALVPTTEFDSYDYRQPGMMAAGSQSLGGTLMAPALFRGRIIALNNRLNLDRVILGTIHPTLLTNGRPVATADGVNPAHYGPPSATVLPATELNTYDPGEFFPDELPPFGNGEVPFLEDEVKATDVAASVALVDGWMYVTYRNGHTRGYSNVGGGGAGTGGNPPYYQLPPPIGGGSNLVEAPFGEPTDTAGPQTGIYILTKVVTGQPAPTLTLNDILDQTVSPPQIRTDVQPLHKVTNLDRSVMTEWGQTLFVAVDFGRASNLVTESGATDPNDPLREIDPQVMEAGNEIQGQIRSNNGAVQQLPGLARGVLPTRVRVPWDTVEPEHVMAVVPVFCGVPSPSNPLTPGTPMLWEKVATDANPFNTFANDLTYDIQITQQGVQWRWPDNVTGTTAGTSNGDATQAVNKTHYWESERNDGAVRFPNTAGQTGTTPKWGWTHEVIAGSNPSTDRAEWAPLLSYNNPFIIEYDPHPTNTSYEGMLGAGGPTDTVTRVDQYAGRNDAGRRNGDPYAPVSGVSGGSVDGSRSGNGHPVVPIVGTAIRTGQVRQQQILFGDHGKTTPVSSSLYPDLAKLRVADRSYLGFVGRPLPTRVQRSPLTKIGKGADYGTRNDATLRNLPGAPAGSFEQNINVFDDGPDQLYPSIADSRVMVTKLGTNLDLGSSPVGVPGRVLPDTNGAFPTDQPGGIPLVGQMETLAVQVDIPRFLADDLYSTRWRGADTAAGSSPNTAFNPFFPGTLFAEAGRALWDRSERRARTPDLDQAANSQERDSLSTRGEDTVSPAAGAPDQDDRLRRVVIFNDANNNGQLDLLPNYREAYRTFGVQVMVKPELKIEAQQAAIDLGNLWHGKQQPGMDTTDSNPATNPELDIREWQRMQLLKGSGVEWQASLGNFYEQFWRPITLLNSGNVNLAYVKPELAYQTAATGVQILAIPSEGNDPWRALPLLNGLTGTPNPLIDPQQIFLRSSFDDQLLPNTNAAYGAGARGVWLQKATVGSALPGVVAYAEPLDVQPTGDPTRRDPGPAQGIVAHPVQGAPRPTFFSLNVPTGAALGQYSGSIRFYNDRSVALQEVPDDSNVPVGYRYIHPTGANVSRNGVLDRRNDGEPLEPVTDPPFQIRARVVENMAYGRSVANGNTLNNDPPGERRQRPAAIPDFSAVSSTGTVRRLLLAWAGNRSGVGAGQPTMYDLYGSRMEMDTGRLLFPFDQVPMLRPQGADFADPWWEMANTANAGFSLLTNVTGLGVNAQATSPSLSQDALFTQSALLAWSERRTLSPGEDQYRFLYQELTPNASAVQELLPGGVPATPATPRLSPRLLPVVLESQNGAPQATTWLAIWATGPAQRRNLAFSYHWDPQTGQVAAKTGQGEFPAGNQWAPENTLPGSKAFSTMSSPYAMQTYFAPRLPAVLPNQPDEPPYIQAENQRLPAMTWVTYPGTSQRLGRTDVYLSRYRTNALLTPRSRGGTTDPLASVEDYSHVRFPRTEAYNGNGEPLGGDTLQANANRTLYTASGSDWLIQAYSPVQFYLARPDFPPDQQGSLAHPLVLLNVNEKAPESPTGELIFPLSDALRTIPGLERFRLMVDPAAGTVRLTGDIRTLARLALGVNLTPQTPDPVLRADYTAATLRLTRAGASAGDPVIVPVTSSSQPTGSPAAVQYYDASWYRQQIDGNGAKWVAGTPVAGIADRLWVFWRRAAGAGGSAAPTTYYKVLRPGIRVSLGAIYGIQPNELAVQVGGNPATPEEVDPQTGQIYFPLNFEGQRVQVSYRGPSGETIQEQHNVSWIDETGERQVPMNTSVNEGSLDAFASFEEVPMTAFGGGNNAARVRKMERIWLFWSSTRGSGGDVMYASLAPRLGPEVNINGSVALFAGNPDRLTGVAPNVAQQRLALVADLERRRPFTLPTILRRGPLAPLPPRPAARGR